MLWKLDYYKTAKWIFIAWALGCVIILPLASMDAGITEDEPVHLEHGHRLLAWYLGKDMTAGESPIDDNGQWLLESPKAINIYGGFFDLLASASYPILFPSLGEYESKHILTAFFGALLIICIGLITQRASQSWGIGLLALVLATFTPRLFGHAMNNPKDLPFATFYAFSILQMVLFFKELPIVETKRAILLALSISLAIAVRSGGVILIFYFILFNLFNVVWQIQCKEMHLKNAARLMLKVFSIAFLGYLGTCLFWPWAMNNPLLNPLRSLLIFNKFDAVLFTQLFEGNWIVSNNLPWYFTIKWVYITIPLTLSFGFVLFLIMTPILLGKNRVQTIVYSLILFSAIFPIFSIILNHSNLYDSARHVFFIIPSIIVIASLAWSELYLQINDRKLKVSFSVAFLILLSEPVLFTFANHPLQALYFSPVIDGMQGAFKNYEMDYYGYSIKKALNWIAQNSATRNDDNKIRVRLWYGDQTKLKYLTDKDDRFQYVQVDENSTDWDYSIQMTSEAKYNHDLLYHWPSRGTVYQVRVNGTPVSAIIKNFRMKKPVGANVQKDPISESLYLEQSYNFYKQGDFNNAIEAAKKVLEYNPYNSNAWNNIAASYGSLGNFDEEIHACNIALEINPDNKLAKNNLSWALSQKSKQEPQ